jgi:hypothetical protein
MVNDKCVDINECANDTHNCHSSQICINTEGSFECVCPNGQEFKGGKCKDINECSDGTHDCNTVTENCINKSPSFECVCKDGFESTGGGECVAIGCDPGYILKNGKCVDINECDEDLHNCHEHATCTNQPGSFICNCNDTLVGNGLHCECPAGQILENGKCKSNPPGDWIKNIHEMGSALFPKGKKKNFKMEDITDYGCAGRGTFDPFSKTLGKHMDHADNLFFVWKKCIQCAADKGSTTVPEYKYDEDTDDCGDSSDNSRPFCECDRALVTKLQNMKPQYSNYDGDKCEKGDPANAVVHQCCGYNLFFNSIYNPDESCCDSFEGVKQIGTC